MDLVGFSPVRVAEATSALDADQDMVQVLATGGLGPHHLHAQGYRVPRRDGLVVRTMLPDGFGEQCLSGFNRLGQQLRVVEQLLHVVAGQTRVVEAGDELRHLSPREIGDTGGGANGPGHGGWAPVGVNVGWPEWLAS